MRGSICWALLLVACSGGSSLSGTSDAGSHVQSDAGVDIQSDADVNAGGGAGRGGSASTLPDHCSNGVWDVLTETDVDCGDDCTPCGPLQVCASHDDCAAIAPACLEGVCMPMGGCVEAPTYDGCGLLYSVAVVCEGVTSRDDEFIAAGYTYWGGSVRLDGVGTLTGGCATRFPLVGGDCRAYPGDCNEGSFLFFCADEALFPGDPPPGKPDLNRCQLVEEEVLCPNGNRLGDTYCCGL